MITFKQFLGEDKDDLKKILERDCGPFLDKSGLSGLLVRGMRHTNRATIRHVEHPLDDHEVIEYYELTTRTDRKPSDTPPSASKIMDDWFNREFGVRARSAGMFCFGDNRHGMGAVGQYGEPYAVFPIGDFKFVWSKDVSDLYSQTDTIIETNLEAFLEEHEYQNNKLYKAIQTKAEIMVVCSKYYAFDYRECEPMLRKILGIE
jgi:hypothetical protein